VKAVPGSIPVADQVKVLTLLEGFGEIMNVPPAQLAAVLAKAKKDLRGE